ncbi:maleylacetoacetate isomerase [Castellaniella caeni]|uniref:maleylacetoacetate isomerase n=1 Tax=Castellaniella caeni TaxID=266123 RepID=UPI00082C2D9F|nr:maleylacetoacetate isomerase [Castellaniella caeni]
MRDLYSYFRSSAAYRVRIALGLKGLDHRIVPVHLLRQGGEQHQAAYLQRNPEGLVPALDDQGHVLTQSLAIIEYLDEVYPGAALLPAEPLARARVRALAQLIACDIHPLNNLRVLRWLAHEMKVDKAVRDAWYRHWIVTGFAAFEAQLRAPGTGLYCQGDTPGLADCCLVPQVYNAQRYEIDLSPYPTLQRIARQCDTLSAFQAARPEAQPDAE